MAVASDSESATPETLHNAGQPITGLPRVVPATLPITPTANYG